MSRRTVLKGLGAAIGLPFLDAMTPAFAALRPAPSAGAPGLVLSPERHRHAALDTGRGRPARRRCPSILAPLEPVKNDIAGAVESDHALGTSAAGGCRRSRPRARLVHDGRRGVQDRRRRSEARDLRAIRSRRQPIGNQTRLPSLEVGLEEARQAGNCDSGYSCAYAYNLAWKTETQPLPPISDPRSLFERLFGSDIVEAAGRPRAPPRDAPEHPRRRDRTTRKRLQDDPRRHRPPQGGRVSDLASARSSSRWSVPRRKARSSIRAWRSHSACRPSSPTTSA